MSDQRNYTEALLLHPILDLTKLEELYDGLRERVAAAEIILDGSAVERVTTPCLQLLAATAKAAMRGEGIFVLKTPSPALIAAIQDLGLGEFIPYEV